MEWKRGIMDVEYDMEDLHKAEDLIKAGYPDIDIDVLANKIYKKRIKNETKP